MNAFFLRLAAATPQADLQMTVSPSAATVSTYGAVTYTVNLKNLGPSAAQNVLIKFPDFNNSQPNFSMLSGACQANAKRD